MNEISQIIPNTGNHFIQNQFYQNNIQDIKYLFAEDFDTFLDIIYNMNKNKSDYKKNNIKDIIDIRNIPKHDVLTIGFYQKKIDKKSVFWKIVEILKYHSPRIVILENIDYTESYSSEDIECIEIMFKTLSNLGYFTKIKNINTNHIQSVLICFKDKYMFDKFFFDDTYTDEKEDKPNQIIESCKNDFNKIIEIDKNKSCRKQLNVVTYHDDNVFYQYNNILLLDIANKIKTIK